jgi:hypothetical protein
LSSLCLLYREESKEDILATYSSIVVRVTIEHYVACTIWPWKQDCSLQWLLLPPSQLSTCSACNVYARILFACFISKHCINSVHNIVYIPPAPVVIQVPRQLQLWLSCWLLLLSQQQDDTVGISGYFVFLSCDLF